MLIRKPADLRYSDVTPRDQYLNRRRFLAAAGIGVAGAWALPSPLDGDQVAGLYTGMDLRRNF
jgi:hypothetical protein